MVYNTVFSSNKGVFEVTLAASFMLVTRKPIFFGRGMDRLGFVGALWESIAHYGLINYGVFMGKSFWELYRLPTFPEKWRPPSLS